MTFHFYNPKKELSCAEPRRLGFSLCCRRLEEPNSIVNMRDRSMRTYFAYSVWGKKPLNGLSPFFLVEVIHDIIMSYLMTIA